jgi:outer membrane protein TolC
MVIRTLAMAVSSLVLAGCVSVGPNYKAPVQEPVVLQGAQQPVFSTASPVASWWAQFDDPVLEQLVHGALSDNLDLRVAVARVSQARAVFVESRFDQAPHITAGGSYDRRKQPDPQLGGQRVFSESYQLGFDAGWELDLFGRKRRAAEAARADLGAEQANLADAQVLVAAEVARNYFELRGTQKRIAVAQHTLVNLRDTQKLTEARWELGAGSELDVQSSRARLKAIEADIPLLEVAETQSRNRLAVLLGQRPEVLTDMLAPHDVPAFAKALPLGDTRELLRQRADVRVAERRLAAATARGRGHRGPVPAAVAVRLRRLPRRRCQWPGQWQQQGLVADPSLSWAAFDFGTVRARLRASKAEAEGVAAQYEQAVLLALEDTENALTRYSKQQARLAIVVEQAQAARRAESLAQIRYREARKTS